MSVPNTYYAHIYLDVNVKLSAVTGQSNVTVSTDHLLKSWNILNSDTYDSSTPDISTSLEDLNNTDNKDVFVAALKKLIDDIVTALPACTNLTTPQINPYNALSFHSQYIYNSITAKSSDTVSSDVFDFLNKNYNGFVDENEDNTLINVELQLYVGSKAANSFHDDDVWNQPTFGAVDNYAIPSEAGKYSDPCIQLLIQISNTSHSANLADAQTNVDTAKSAVDTAFDRLHTLYVSQYNGLTEEVYNNITVQNGVRPPEIPLCTWNALIDQYNRTLDFSTISYLELNQGDESAKMTTYSDQSINNPSVPLTDYQTLVIEYFETRETYVAATANLDMLQPPTPGDGSLNADGIRSQKPRASMPKPKKTA